MQAQSLLNFSCVDSLLHHSIVYDTHQGDADCMVLCSSCVKLSVGNFEGLLFLFLEVVPIFPASNP